jgi:hypothetical protein
MTSGRAGRARWAAMAARLTAGLAAAIPSSAGLAATALAALAELAGAVPGWNVTDTATGTVRTYRNPQGTAFVPLQETPALACP